MSMRNIIVSRKFILQSMAGATKYCSTGKNYSTIGGTLRVRSAVPLTCNGVELKPLQSVSETPGLLLEPQSIRRPLISPEAPINTTQPASPVYYYDIETAPGEVYELCAAE